MVLALLSTTPWLTVRLVSVLHGALAAQATATRPLTPLVATLTPMRCPRTTARLCARRTKSASACAWTGNVMVAGVTSFIIANFANRPRITMVKSSSSSVKPATACLVALVVHMVRLA